MARCCPGVGHSMRRRLFLTAGGARPRTPEHEVHPSYRRSPMPDGDITHAPSLLHGPGGEDGPSGVLETGHPVYGSGPCDHRAGQDYAQRALRAAGIQPRPSTFLRSAITRGRSAALDVARELGTRSSSIPRRG